jgi:hypothetical protein
MLAVALALVLRWSSRARALRARGGVNFYKKLRVGSGATLRGGDGTRIGLTLLRFVDPIRSRLYRPRKGTRFIAFRLRYANVGNVAYQSIPAAEVELVDRNGRIYDSGSSFYGGVVKPWPALKPDLNYGLTVAPRERWAGYMGWIVPARLRLSEFRYTVSSGPDTVAWLLGR